MFHLGYVHPFQMKNKDGDDSSATTHFMLVEVDDPTFIRSDTRAILWKHWCVITCAQNHSHMHFMEVLCVLVPNEQNHMQL